MKRSLVWTVSLPLLIASVIVGVLLLKVVPDRQLRALETSTIAELENLAQAFAVSVEMAFEQQNLDALAELSALVRGDGRDLIAAVIVDTASGPDVLGEFPEGSGILDILLNPEHPYIEVAAPVHFGDESARVLILSHRSSLEDRMSVLNAPVYFAFLMICLVQLVLFLLLSRYVVAPIISAASVADKLGAGDFRTTQPRQARRDELGLLLLSLRRLRTRLRLQRRQNIRLLGSLEAKVEQRTEELKKALDAKDKFLAAVSHELRTPLHSIIASLDLLGSSHTLVGDEDKRYVRLARRGSVALMQLINELLDFQRLSQREVILNEEAEDLGPLLAECLETSALLFEESEVDFQTKIDIPEGLWVSVDGHRVAQILFNLVSNARKFTRVGTVSISVASRPQKDGCVAIDFAVQDTGIGMDAATVARLGEAFFQGEAGLNRKFAGTGLGLSIVNRILLAMNSTLEVTSLPEEGSTFAFSLVLRTVRQDAVSSVKVKPAIIEAVSQKSAQPAHCRMLYIEDSDTNRQVMSALLGRFDVVLDLAESALEGYEKITANPYDVIVTDIQMPDYSGIDLLEWYTENPGANADTPVYACTANVTPEARERYFSLGFHGMLAKPFTLAELKEFMAGLKCRS